MRAALVPVPNLGIETAPAIYYSGVADSDCGLFEQRGRGEGSACWSAHWDI